MEIYTFLRHMADSWFLLAMTLGFLALCVWAFRPGSRTTHEEVAKSIFRNDERPAEDPPATNRKEA
ncbi:cbb3-type cytochrome c oxidase subunit 3 [Tabrizicola sp.]|uniref:cbb3-type cytochrome c oxidase subunit 3 n=1 Tax=Tabrizicola sp. TaxID=2005166 RepID=UPI002869F069|nr:cbb3-type cytochrome c oxidase subunit 3 [Tabrizicola sp.]